MTSRGTKFWDSGEIPLIAPEILGNIIAEVADLGIVISDAGDVLSVLVNPMYDSFRSLERWEGRNIRSALTTESVKHGITRNPWHWDATASSGVATGSGAGDGVVVEQVFRRRDSEGTKRLDPLVIPVCRTARV